MLVPLIRAFADLRAPALRRIVGLCLALAAASFALLWIALALVVAHTGLLASRPLEWLVEVLGAVVVFVLVWLLFPAVVTMVMGLFLDRIAAAVETLNYPGQGPTRHAPIAETILATARLMGLTILVNLLALPVYLLMPGVNFFVFLGLNGYLFGREYFEVVALRRLGPTDARAMRRRFAGRVFLGGVAIAALFVVPLVNLLAPIVGIALMVHIFEGLRQVEPRLLAS
ncbi:MAG TPA: EI24 domain-containing protein [Stellaceae bacterium]|nr:EI24 domain-containing protein [Stellaceae bacterium]